MVLFEQKGNSIVYIVLNHLFEMKNNTSVIGSGFSAAAVLAHKGFDVNIYKKNSQSSWRASEVVSTDFTFDSELESYWMVDVFDRYLSKFIKSGDVFYALKRLNPSNKMFYGKNDFIDIPERLNESYTFFKQIEHRGAKEFSKILKETEYKYNIVIKRIVNKL